MFIKKDIYQKSYLFPLLLLFFYLGYFFKWLNIKNRYFVNIKSINKLLLLICYSKEKMCTFFLSCTSFQQQKTIKRKS